jgi:hypothetical protein
MEQRETLPGFGEVGLAPVKPVLKANNLICKRDPIPDVHPVQIDVIL